MRWICGVATMLLFAQAGVAQSPSPLLPPIQSYVGQRLSEFEQISAERRARLDTLAKAIREELQTGDGARLNFICTHNSRRSHMSQIWAAAAATHFGIDRVHTYSGGTESTAFNPRAVAALERAGFRIAKTTEDDNPVCHVQYAELQPPITSFSKIYNQAPNPAKGFCAVMTCSQADKACPIVAGASRRIAIPFDDPKAFDGTKQEAQKYDERCAQISRELLYAFSRVKG